MQGQFRGGNNTHIYGEDIIGKTCILLQSGLHRVNNVDIAVHHSVNMPL